MQSIGYWLKSTDSCYDFQTNALSCVLDLILIDFKNHCDPTQKHKGEFTHYPFFVCFCPFFLRFCFFLNKYVFFHSHFYKSISALSRLLDIDKNFV